MGRATREANVQRLVKINELLTWAKTQQAAFAAVSHFSKDCLLYAELPKLPGGMDPFARIPTKRMVLIPNAIDEKDVVVPVGFRRVFGQQLGKTHLMICVTTTEPDSEGHRTAVNVELGLGLEILLPGGTSAWLVQRGGLVSIEDRTPDEVAAADAALAAAKRPDPARAISLQPEEAPVEAPAPAAPEVPAEDAAPVEATFDPPAEPEPPKEV